MMSAPAARTSSWCTPLIAPWVPTGMKAGVRATPCAVVISPVRAAPSVAISRNENESAIAAYLSEQQASVAIGVEAVIALNCMAISAAHDIEPAKGADQHEKGRTWQMKIGEHRIDGAETITGGNEQSGLAGKWPQRAVTGGGAFQKAQRGRADGDDATAGTAHSVQG